MDNHRLKPDYVAPGHAGHREAQWTAVRRHRYRAPSRSRPPILSTRSPTAPGAAPAHTCGSRQASDSGALAKPGSTPPHSVRRTLLEHPRLSRDRKPRTSPGTGSNSKARAACSACASGCRLSCVERKADHRYLHGKGNNVITSAISASPPPAQARELQGAFVLHPWRRSCPDTNGWSGTTGTNLLKDAQGHPCINCDRRDRVYIAGPPWRYGIMPCSIRNAPVCRGHPISGGLQVGDGQHFRRNPAWIVHGEKAPPPPHVVKPTTTAPCKGAGKR